MDSSNSDSFGSFGVSGGAGGASGSGVIASGSDSGAAMPTGVPAGISSGGPVVIGGGTQEKKGKKWIVLLAVVFVVAALVGFAVLMMMPRNSKSDKNVIAYTNEYLSLLATGEKSDAVFDENKLTSATISSGELKNIYVIPRFYTSLEEDSANYYKELQTLLDEIKNRSAEEKYSDEQKDEIAFFVDNSKTMLSYYFVATALSYTNSDYEYYLKNGSLDGFLSVYDYPFAETDDEVLLYFGSVINTLYESKKSFYETVSKTSCVKDERIDYACLEEINSKQIEELQGQNSELTSILETQVSKMLNLIVVDAKEINELINGGSNG